MNTTMQKCASDGCAAERKGNSKYCPACAKVARQKWLDMIREKAAAKDVRDADFQKIHDEAHAAGMVALNAAVPAPMVVQQHLSVADDASPVTQQWYVTDGACGFAWVIVRPGTCSFARWTRKHKGWGLDYYGGASLHVHEGGQSIERKVAYAAAFAAVLNKHGITASMNSRLD